jgi:hypothetical protein
MYALGVILIEFLLGISVDGRQVESIAVTRFVGELLAASLTLRVSGGPQRAKELLLATRFHQLR